MTLANAKPDLWITGPLGTSMVNAASSAWHDVITVEAKITAAIAYAVSIGAKYCYVPDCFLPYTASLVTFNNAVKMVREGGAIAIHDPQAYGAAGNAVITARASGAGTKATITGQDDTVALQACINAAAANLEIVQLPPNAYKITAALTLPTNTQLVGSGWNSQICPDWFDASAGQSGGQAYLVNADTTNGNANIRIQGFYLNGAGPGTPTGSGLPNGAAAGMLLRGTSVACTDIIIRDLKITNTPGISIAYQGCQRIQIINNLIHDVGKDGITGAWNGASANLTDVLVQGNTIFQPGDDGIAVLGSINGANSTARPTRIAIVGNTIRDILGTSGAGRGIIVAGCELTTVSANVIHNTFSCGIAIWYDTIVVGGSKFSSRRIAVTGNVVQDAGQAGDGSQPQQGIYLLGVTYSALVGNCVDHAKTNGILVSDATLAEGACSWLAINDNAVTNCGTTAASDTAIAITAGIAGGIQHVNIIGNVAAQNVAGGIGNARGTLILIEGNHCTNNGTAGGHGGSEAGIWSGSSSAIATTVVVRGNFCTDTQGTKTQTAGFCAHNLGTAITELTLQDNYFKGNFNAGVNGEVLLNIAPTKLIYRRDDTTPFVLTDAATVAVNALVGEAIVLTATAGVGATRAIGLPTNPSIGQRLLLTFIQDGTGGRALTWNAAFKNVWSDTGNTASKRSSMAHVYDGTNWNQDGAQTPYA